MHIYGPLMLHFIFKAFPFVDETAQIPQASIQPGRITPPLIFLVHHQLFRTACIGTMLT